MVGTLNVYAERPHAWDESETAAMESLTRVLEAQFAAAAARFRSEQLISQLEHALAQRVTSDRAIGVLMERDSLDPVAAFGALRRRAP